MAIKQDSTHPTGVDGPVRKHGEGGNRSIDRARQRKANAAVEMRLAHATWEEIAEVLGYPTARQALVATEKALEDHVLNMEDREALRAMAGARLERLTKAVWPKAIDQKHPDQMAAQREARANMDRYIKLFGLDAPTEVVVHSPTENEIEQWVNSVTMGQTPTVEEPDIFEIDTVEEEPRALPAE
jgi:hypothetical protein